jgi:hypothetical protein
MSQEKRDINNIAELETNTAFPEIFLFPYKMIPEFASTTHLSCFMML